MKIYDVILEGSGHGEVDALEWARGFEWSECGAVEQDRPMLCRYIDSVDGIGVYYDFGADYYFFEEE